MARGKQNKFNERNASSYNRTFRGIETRSGKREPFVVISFKDYDRNQGQTFDEWQDDKLLALAVSKLQAICCLTRLELTTQQIVKEYPKGQFPPNSDFYHPKHIADDISWCSMHIQGKECVIGYFDDNVFYIVFLDKDHRFWITVKKNT